VNFLNGKVSMKSGKRFVAGLIWIYSLSAFAMMGCDITVESSLRGSGVKKAETREVASFSEIEVGSAIQLDMTIGPANSLVVTSDENILPHVTTVVANDRLKVYVDTSYSTDLNVKVKVTTPMLRTLPGERRLKIDIDGRRGRPISIGP